MAEPESDPAPMEGRSRGRAVIWTGVVVGSWLAFQALHAHLNLTFLLDGVLPALASTLLNVLLIWALTVVLTTIVTDVLRRHHRLLARHTAAGAVRAARASAKHTRRHGGRLGQWAGRKIAARTSALIGRIKGDCTEGDDDAAPAVTRRVDGKPETAADKKFFDLRESGYAGPVDQDGNAVTTSTNPTEGERMTTNRSRIEPDRRGARAASAAGAQVPVEWRAVVAQTSDFEPEDDGDLITWMGGQTAGAGAWAESLIDVYESGTRVIGIDPEGLKALHDVADAAAQAAELMATAITKFKQHYELPREFAANGGQMTHDGRWVTGEGA
jgi:hypothetical protein